MTSDSSNMGPTETVDSVTGKISRPLADRASGALVKADVNLLAVALSSGTLSEASEIINDVFKVTGIDLLDPKLAEILTDKDVVDKLQSYETTMRAHLTEIMERSYQLRAFNDQRSVTRVRYNKFRMWYGGSITCFACGYMLYITIMDISYADTVLGFLMGTLVGTVVTFYFGSSAKQGDLSENEVVRERYNHSTSPKKEDIR